MFDGSTDPYDHMFHYNQAMTMNAGDDLLLCKVFSTSLRGPTLTWFHKLPRSSIHTLNKLCRAFISQNLCSVHQKGNISSLQTILKHEDEYIRGLYEDVRASRLTKRILQHGCSPSELQKKLWAVNALIPLAISRPAKNNGRIILAGKPVLNIGGQYSSGNPDSHDHKSAGQKR